MSTRLTKPVSREVSTRFALAGVSDMPGERWIVTLCPERGLVFRQHRKRKEFAMAFEVALRHAILDEYRVEVAAKKKRKRKAA